MRTVTFSDEKVAKLINDNFVCSWVNRNPKFHNCETDTERRIVSNSFESYATKNFCTFFVTPDLDVLHYFSGYWSPSFFTSEVEFVLGLAKKVCDENGRLRTDRLAEYRSAHRTHASEHADKKKVVMAVKAPTGNSAEAREFKEKQEQWRSRKDNLCQGMDYLDKVHSALEKRSVRKGKPYKLDDVIRNYMGGNEFTEE
jgi:hypothetical protein